MGMERILAANWTLDPSVLGGCAALLTARVAWTREERWRRLPAFAFGVALLALALESPLHAIGERYLFSAHMIQHLVLILGVPPLLIAGLPPRATRRLLRAPALRRLERALGHPGIAFGAATVALWLWHLPALYDAALVHHGLHVLEHLIFLVTWTMFWWPLLAPLPSRRLGTPGATGYLAGALVSGSILGIILTFAPAGTYPFYVAPPDPFGYLAFFRNAWGLSAAVDQQVGGLIMWVPGGVVYIGAILVLFGRWIGAEEQAGEPAPARGAPPTGTSGRAAADPAGDAVHTPTTVREGTL